jgi:hypothetical protein
MSRNKTLKNLQDNTQFSELLKLNKSHQNYHIQIFSQYSNQHIRHQQNSSPSPNKHQLTNLQFIKTPYAPKLHE